MAARDHRQALGEGETWVHPWFWGQQFVEATSELLVPVANVIRLAGSGESDDAAAG